MTASDLCAVFCPVVINIFCQREFWPNQSLSSGKVVRVQIRYYVLHSAAESVYWAKLGESESSASGDGPTFVFHAQVLLSMSTAITISDNSTRWSAMLTKLAFSCLLRRHFDWEVKSSHDSAGCGGGLARREARTREGFIIQIHSDARRENP